MVQLVGKKVSIEKQDALKEVVQFLFHAIISFRVFCVEYNAKKKELLAK